MTRPLGLSSLRRWNRQRAEYPCPTTRSPWLRVVLAALVVVCVITALSVITQRHQALRGASPEIEAAYQRGYQAAMAPRKINPVQWDCAK